MSRFTRAEIEAAFQHFQAAADQSAKTGDWRAWSECFTEDADYTAFDGTLMQGRQAIAAQLDPSSTASCADRNCSSGHVRCGSSTLIPP